MSDLIVPEAEIPTWLSSEFFRELLSITGKIKLRNVQHACAKGDNFCSNIYRVEIVYDDTTTQWLVVKSRPTDGGFSEEFTKKFEVFAKEMEVYEYIDRFEGIFRSLNVDVTFAPKCLKVTNKPTEILLIEDLNAKGYKMAKKSEGLSLSEMTIALKKLAQFHAASAVYYENNGAYGKKFERGIYNADMKEIFDSSFESNFGFVLKLIDTWPNLDRRIVDKMKKWNNFNLLKELIRTMSPKSDQFNCLTHGDAWLANILFQYDENGQLQDCQFIDFQQSVYTTPALDLLSLIFTSAKTETKLQNFEFFIKFYHEQLVEALNMLNYCKKIPTLKELYLDVIDRGFLGVWHGFAVLPTCLAENVKESSTDNLLGENEAGQLYKEKIYNNERYRQHMTELLNYFNDRGLVDLC